MATKYESSTTTTSSSSLEIGLDKDYLKSLQGLLKILECVLDVVAFICASYLMVWAGFGGGWVQFVTMSAFITTLMLFGFHLFRVIYQLPGPWNLIELIYYFLYSLMMLVAGIVCAARGSWHDSIAAAAFFTFAATAVYMLDTFLLFRAWQSGPTTAAAAQSTTTTTVQEQKTYESKAQY